MRALRVIGQTVIHEHGTSQHDTCYISTTACGLRVVWKNAVRWIVQRRPLAEHVDDPVDCMTCLVNVALGK